MRRFSFVAVVCFIALAAVVPTRSATAAPNVQPARVQLSASMSRIVDLVNQRRREAGLAPVTVNASLMTCAQQYSEVIASLGSLTHTGPDGSSPGQRLTRCGYRWQHYGEDLAAGYSDPDQLMAAWMASPSHRRVILLPNVREIGLGYARRDGDPNAFYDYYAMELSVRR